MEKTRFAIISALFRLSKIIGRSLKLAESLASGRVEDEAGNKDICKNIRREMKTVPALLNEVREYIAEHDDKELAHQFVRLHGDAKRLHDLCSAYLQDLGKEALYAGIVYTSIEVIGQYFFPDGSRQGKARPMTRIEATDCIDTIRTVIRKCTAETGENKGKDDIGEEAYALLADGQGKNRGRQGIHHKRQRQGFGTVVHRGFRTSRPPFYGVPRRQYKDTVGRD